MPSPPGSAPRAASPSSTSRRPAARAAATSTCWRTTACIRRRRCIRNGRGWRCRSPARCSRAPRTAESRPRAWPALRCGSAMPVPRFPRNSAMSPDPAVRARIEALLQANQAVLFMKGSPQAPQCGFSAKAVSALDALGADYAHVDVLADGEIREGIKAYGDWPTIPQLYIGGELVGGSDIIVQMLNSGELHAAL